MDKEARPRVLSTLPDTWLVWGAGIQTPLWLPKSLVVGWSPMHLRSLTAEAP